MVRIDGIAIAYQSEYKMDPDSEVRELHAAIAGWLHGATVDFNAFADVLAPEFTLIDPDGVMLDRAEVLRDFEQRRGAAPDLILEIRNLRPVIAEAGVSVMTYEEWQIAPATARTLLATAVFVADEQARHGVRWRHLHENCRTREMLDHSSPPRAADGR